MPTPRPRTRKDGTVYYQVRFRLDRDGVTIATSESFDEPKRAYWFAELIERIGAAKASEVLARRLEAEKNDVTTLTAWLRRYADRLTGIEPATRKRYHRYIDQDIDPFFDGSVLPVDAVTQDTDAAWVVHMEEELGHRPKTIANKHGFLSAAMSAAARQRPNPLIASNPCAETRLPKVYAPELDIFEPEEYELFEQLLAPRWRAQAELAVMSMARPSEQGALNVEDIDSATGAVRITKAYKYANGALRMGTPKSVRGVRTTFVPVETAARLDLDRPRGSKLFATSTGGPITVTYLYRKGFLPALNRLRALAEGDDGPFGGHAHWEGESPAVLREVYGHLIPGLAAKRITPYTLRHTGISWRLQDGEPIWVVSRDAGHESVQTTDRRYGHISSSASAASAAVVAGRLPRLRQEVVSLERARREKLVRAGQLGEISPVLGGFEAVWMDADGVVRSRVVATHAEAVGHVARFEAGPVLAA